MATKATTDAVQKLYLGYYGRPADSAGLTYWANQLDTNGSSYEAVIAAFTQAPESQALYGPSVTIEARIGLLYHQFFNRDVEAAGLAYWKPLVENGTFTLGRLAISILVGAQNDDKTAVENKLTVADLFTSLAAGAQSKYEGASAAAVGRTLLDLITSASSSVTTGTDRLNAYLNTANVASLVPDQFTSYISGGVLTNTSLVSTQLTTTNIATLAAPAPAPTPAPAPATFSLTEAANVVTLSGTSTDAFVYALNGAATRSGNTVTASSGSLTNNVTGFNSSAYAGSGTITLSTSGDSFTGGAAADTLKVLAFAVTGTLNGGATGANTLQVTDGANLTGATISNFTNLTFDSTSVSGTNDLTLTAAQYAFFTGTVTGAGSGTNGEKVILTTALTGGTSLFAAVENFTLATGANSVTTGSAGQSINAQALASGEALTLAGTHTATVTLVGGNVTSTSSGNLTVIAGAGNSTIITGAAADTVTGGAGNDTITLGGASDVVVFNSLTGADTLTDFVAGTDRIQLSKAVFTALAGAVNDVTLGTDFASVANAAALTGGSIGASTNAQALVYLQDVRTLYYNSDGATANGLTLVGTFNTGVLLAATDFTIIT